MSYVNPKKWKRQRDVKMNLAKEICEDCGKKAKDVHHKDKTRYNHTLSNLKALCRKCHQSYHPKGKVDSFIKVFSHRIPKKMTIWKQLKLARIDADMEQGEAAGITGIAQSSISEIERGKTSPQISTIKRLLDCYGYKIMIVKQEA